jgi:hypothetical protein
LHAVAAFHPAERPAVPTDFVALGFHDPEAAFHVADLELLRSQHETWLLQSGFAGLIRGLSATLQEAMVYCRLLEFVTGTTPTVGELTLLASKTRRQATKKPFPELAATVSKKLSGQLELVPHVLSLNDVRNCLEHRGGIVSEADTKGNSGLELSWRRQRILWVNPIGEEVLLRPPMVLSGGRVISRVTDASRSFAIGERIVLTPADFVDVAFTCYAFAIELSQKLPTAIGGN